MVIKNNTTFFSVINLMIAISAVQNKACKKIGAISSSTDSQSIDSRSEYLFRTCSVATSLVTSLPLYWLYRASVLWWRRSDSRFAPHLSITNLIILLPPLLLLLSGVLMVLASGVIPAFDQKQSLLIGDVKTIV